MTDVVHPGAYLTNSALFLDIDELAADPAAAPAPAPAVILAAPAVVVSNNNGFGSSIVTNTNTNANGFPAGGCHLRSRGTCGLPSPSTSASHADPCEAINE